MNIVHFAKLNVLGSGAYAFGDWSLARGEWDVAYGLKTSQEFDIVRQFFHARRGRAIGFRFKDWADYVVSRQIIAPTAP
jgi:uncharacterized protein (TIGR02217 family)